MSTPKVSGDGFGLSFQHKQKTTRPMSERKKEFQDRMRGAITGRDAKYNNSKFLNAFYSYWTEHPDDDQVKANTKMRFEMKKNQPFNTFRRMVTFWNRSGDKFWQEPKDPRKLDKYTPPKIKHKEEPEPEKPKFDKSTLSKDDREYLERKLKHFDKSESAPTVANTIGERMRKKFTGQ